MKFSNPSVSLSEQTMDVGEDLCPCFIVWQKIFDRINLTKLEQILKTTGID
jgi:hypothetical protein